MKNFIVNVAIALSFCYLLFQGIFIFDPAAALKGPLDEYFSNGYYYFGAVLILAFSCVAMGSMVRKAEKLRLKNAMIVELEAQQTRLTEYIKLASLITRKDADTLITDYIQKIENKYKLDKDKE